MKIAVVMCLKSDLGLEAYYVDMALLSLLPYVQGIYIQDQGCKDNTIDVVKGVVGGKVPLAIEDEINSLPRFSLDYNEPVYRNKAIERCEALFNPDWIIQVDADDIFTPLLFEKVMAADLTGYNGIFYASDRFITPEYMDGYRGHLIEFGGRMWADPHYKFWRAAIRLRYPDVHAGHFHNVPATDCNPVFCVEGICNIHLHRMFGPKAFNFWRSDGDEFEETKPFNPRKQAPKWFSSPVNMGSAIKIDYPWPDFIMDKWKEWGVYD
jgi:glycosyltransferase involved in cell wall biosynthesis